MQVRPLGSSGLDASVVAFGAWTIGGWMWGGADEMEAVKAVQAAIDAGVTLIDTAPMYGYGRSETVIGQAIRGRRDQVVLASKCGLQWREEKGAFHFCADDEAIRESGSIRVYRWLAPESIRIEIEESLTRLGVDCIDLYQTHWQDPSTPLDETIAVLEALRDEGKIRAYGCCNATPEHMDRYRQGTGFVSDQEKYSMLDRVVEAEHLPYCARHGLAFLAYSPLAQGLLTGTLGPDRAFPPGDQRSFKPRYAKENRRKVSAFLDEIRPVADDRGLTLAQLVIAWTAAQPGCSHVLCGARTARQARENAAAGAVVLRDDELKRVRDALESAALDAV